jgi:secondary thiamine-phosphate synthase enzyme
MIWQKEISLPPFSRGFHLITDFICKELDTLPKLGILHVFIKHTSAGIALNENYDPSVRLDLHTAFNELVKEDMPYYTHTLEGSDDMPAHIKSVLVGSSVSVPISGRKLNLGTWQGIYLCEFRNNGGSRRLVLTVYGEDG